MNPPHDGLAILPMIRSGKVRALAVCGATRGPGAPEIPTMSEAGLPGYESSLWYGLLGPANLPPAVVGKLSAAVADVLRQPDVQERLTSVGVTTMSGGPEQFAALIRSEFDKWAKATATISKLQ